MFSYMPCVRIAILSFNLFFVNFFLCTCFLGRDAYNVTMHCGTVFDLTKF